MSHFFFFAWTAETPSTIKVLFVLYFVSVPESESIRSPESEWESKQPHHDSAPLLWSVHARSARANVRLQCVWGAFKAQ